MGRTITLIVGVAVLALTVAGPAFGQGRYGGSQPQVDFWNYESGAKASNSSPGVAPGELAQLYSSIRAGNEPGTNVGVPDLAQLLVAKNGVVDRSVTNALPAPIAPVASDTGGSDTAIAWAEVGAGLGIGVTLVLGLGIAIGVTRTRPFAH